MIFRTNYADFQSNHKAFNVNEDNDSNHKFFEWKIRA